MTGTDSLLATGADMVTTSVVRLDERFELTDAAAERMASVLSLIEQLLRLKGVQVAHQKVVLSEALWKWTEAPGMAPYAKYNIRYCSEGVVNAARNGPHQDINHEHVHTRKSIIQSLLKRHDWDRRRLEDFFINQGHACIVTLAEHAALGLSSRVGWDRYADAGVRVYDRQIGEFVQLSGIELDDEGAESVRRAADPDAVREALAQYANPPYRDQLFALEKGARVKGGITALQQSKSAKPTYFRVHDTLIQEPTRTVAYCNFGGTIDFALVMSDLPEGVASLDQVQERPANRGKYRVRNRLTKEGDLSVPLLLLDLALEKLRAEYE